MHTLRFNPFNQVHKGLRALLYDTALLLQHTDFSTASGVREVVGRVALVHELFEHHAEVEDGRIFPMIAAQAPELVKDFEAQHVEDHALSEGLLAITARFVETNSVQQNRYFGEQLLQHFNGFLAFNVEHMRKEETLVNEVLWQQYTDADLLAKVQEIGASIPPEQNAHFLFWILRGLADHEIAAWFVAVRATVPSPVFDFFVERARAALPPHRLEALTTVLASEPATATI